jgi:SAM-dependent methyltransferase
MKQSLRYAFRRSLNSILVAAKIGSLSNESTLYCPTCKTSVHQFLPLPEEYVQNARRNGFTHRYEDFETLNVDQYLCPVCGASDRDRLYAIFLDREAREGRIQARAALIDFAPSHPLRRFIQKYGNYAYRSADLFMKDVDDTGVDITNMSIYRDDSFDMFICSHILEHVVDDKKALSELYRILRPGGQGILMTPILLSIDQTLESSEDLSERERWRRFGQDDHVRLYARKDFIERVQDAGFVIHEYRPDWFGDVFRFGISDRSVLYVIEKP